METKAEQDPRPSSGQPQDTASSQVCAHGQFQDVVPEISAEESPGHAILGIQEQEKGHTHRLTPKHWRTDSSPEQPGYYFSRKNGFTAGQQHAQSSAQETPRPIRNPALCSGNEAVANLPVEEPAEHSAFSRALGLGQRLPDDSINKTPQNGSLKPTQRLNHGTNYRLSNDFTDCPHSWLVQGPLQWPTQESVQRHGQWSGQQSVTCQPLQTQSSGQQQVQWLGQQPAQWSNQQQVQWPGGESVQWSHQQPGQWSGQESVQWCHQQQVQWSDQPPGQWSGQQPVQWSGQQSVQVSAQQPIQWSVVEAAQWPCQEPVQWSGQ